MDQIHHIRELFYKQGKNMTEIATILGCDRRTIRKYVDMEDFSSPVPEPASDEQHTSKLDPYKPIIDQWPMDDRKAPCKQRHTAKRAYNRLKEVEGFDCSYSLVADYVAERKSSVIPQKRRVASHWSIIMEKRRRILYSRLLRKWQAPQRRQVPGVELSLQQWRLPAPELW